MASATTLTYALCYDVVPATNQPKLERLHDWSIRRDYVVMPDRPTRYASAIRVTAAFTASMKDRFEPKAITRVCFAPCPLCLLEADVVALATVVSLWATSGLNGVTGNRVLCDHCSARQGSEGTSPYAAVLREAWRINYRPVRTMRTANGVVFRKFHVGMPVRKNTTHA